jgi:protein-tyrosine kinase
MNSNLSIGEILMASGRLNEHQTHQILERQKVQHVQFGDAGIALNLLKQSDVDFALSKQFDYTYFSDKEKDFSSELVAAYHPFSSVVENLRAIRSQLSLRWTNANTLHKVFALVSPENAEGRSFVAANLAIVFAQQGLRTLLIDADLRSTAGRGQHVLFNIDKTSGLSGILAGRGGLEEATPVDGLPTLQVLIAGTLPPNPQELLGRPAFAKLLREATGMNDIVIIDTPAADRFSDAEIIASRAGGAVVVARKNKSSTPGTAHLAQRLQNNNVLIYGSILNDA